MPWTMGQEAERRSFVEDVDGEESFAELCRRAGISRKTGYKWKDRYEQEGIAGLRDRSRAPHSMPWALPKDMKQWLLDARIAHPKWGPRKLVAWLGRRHPRVTAWPALSTIGDLLQREGLVHGRGRRRRIHREAPSPFDDARGPNAVWCIDFKGWFRTRDGAKCNPLTVSDAVTRFLFCCQHMRGTEPEVRGAMANLFREYGLPERVHSDNGPPFGSRGVAGFSRLSVWLVRLGIQVTFSEPGRPDQNGRHERMHRTVQDAVGKDPQANLRLQQKALDEFRHEFNWERPHQALDDRTPGALYERSPRFFPERIPEPEYPDAEVVRRVRTNGTIKWNGDLVFVGESFRGQPLGIEPLMDGRRRVRFCGHALGVIDETQRRLVAP